jgi:zinc-ribbon domain
MALIICPECGRKVSSQATTCPQCGFPLAQSQAPDLAAILCNGSWLARSGTLVDAQLTAAFSSDYTFQGQTTPDPSRVAGMQLVAATNFRGSWQVNGPQLFLEFPLTMASGPAQTQIAIQFTRIAEDGLSGVDRYLRPWEWQRLATQEALQSQMDKQKLLGTMLTTLADMRLEMLKGVVAKFDEEEAAKEAKPKRTRKKKSD